MYAANIARKKIEIRETEQIVLSMLRNAEHVEMTEAGFYARYDLDGVLGELYFTLLSK